MTCNVLAKHQSAHRSVKEHLSGGPVVNLNAAAAAASFFLLNSICCWEEVSVQYVVEKGEV